MRARIPRLPRRVVAAIPMPVSAADVYEIRLRSPCPRHHVVPLRPGMTWDAVADRLRAECACTAGARYADEIPQKGLAPDGKSRMFRVGGPDATSR